MCCLFEVNNACQSQSLQKPRGKDRNTSEARTTPRLPPPLLHPSSNLVKEIGHRLREMGLEHPIRSNDINAFPFGPFFFSLIPFFLLCTLIPIVYLRRSRLRLPPGPPGLPAIGHLHLLGTEIHRSLWELSKRYGPLMFLRFGSPTAVAMHITECKDLLFSQPGPISS
ncbi:hypothetical protein KP509_16G057000 [Ceratopteris richardii]|uniref:Cytochrome P450 n=1 Tax=Ceratopteris richardii TaxID=49495 RepID=A0A8T2T0L2_CERRI|nr:hypothetical protein KP509_16G057000 [Ceratopteris richardii]